MKGLAKHPHKRHELIPEARVTGWKGVYRESRIHALDQKELGIRFAASHGRRYEDMNLIICHIGGGTSVTAHCKTCASLCGWAAILFGTLCGILMLLFTDPLLHFLGTLPEVMPDARAYMRTLAVGAPLMLFSTGYGTLLRSEGAVKDGFIGNLFGTAANLILDPLFIMVLKLGVAGAAAATVIGNLVATAYYLRFVFRKASIKLISKCKSMPEK